MDTEKLNDEQVQSAIEQIKDYVSKINTLSGALINSGIEVNYDIYQTYFAGVRQPINKLRVWLRRTL